MWRISSICVCLCLCLCVCVYLHVLILLLLLLFSVFFFCRIFCGKFLTLQHFNFTVLRSNVETILLSRIALAVQGCFFFLASILSIALWPFKLFEIWMHSWMHSGCSLTHHNLLNKWVERAAMCLTGNSNIQHRNFTIENCQPQIE